MQPEITVLKNSSGKYYGIPLRSVRTTGVINVEGKEIEKLQMNNSGSSEIKNLDSGIYLLELNLDGNLIRRKVVVIR